MPTTTSDAGVAASIDCSFRSGFNCFITGNPQYRWHDSSLSQIKSRASVGLIRRRLDFSHTKSLTNGRLQVSSPFRSLRLLKVLLKDSTRLAMSVG
jgi:hypothetical protein